MQNRRRCALPYLVRSTYSQREASPSQPPTRKRYSPIFEAHKVVEGPGWNISKGIIPHIPVGKRSVIVSPLTIYETSQQNVLVEGAGGRFFWTTRKDRRWSILVYPHAGLTLSQTEELSNTPFGKHALSRVPEDSTTATKGTTKYAFIHPEQKW